MARRLNWGRTTNLHPGTRQWHATTGSFVPNLFCDDNEQLTPTATTNADALPGTAIDFASYATQHRVSATAFSQGAVLAMEKWVVRSAGEDRLERRKQLYLVACRNVDDNDTMSCPDTLSSRKCQTISKPLRLWAHHMALVVAAKESQ